MRISLFFLLICVFSIYADNSYSQNARVTINKSNAQLKEVLNEIESQTDYLFIYNNKVNVKKKVNIDVNHTAVSNVLNSLFNGTDIHYSMEGAHIVLTTKDREENEISGTTESAGVYNTAQQTRTISGVIKDNNRVSVIGASIVVKGNTSIGTTTDIDGKFRLNVPSGTTTIVISYLGYETQEVTIGDKTEFDIILKENASVLDEVVVTALGIKRSEKALGYSAQNISGDELTAVKGTNIATSLSGKVAGLTILNKNEFNSAPAILLRGEKPLVVIDGVPFENTGLGDLSADDIESLTVLKGATASALYGEKGASGAVMVTTKRGSKEGLSINVNSSTMFNLGYLVIPEVQSSYSSGSGGKYLQGKSEYIWGDKLDIGRTALQYNPNTYEWEEMPLVSKGKDNFKNFLETSFITNNNINVAYKAKNGSVRTSFTHIYNKGQFPGNKINKFAYTVAGDMKVGKLSLDASITYNGNYTPQYLGSGYSGQGYMYNLIVWTGTEFDLREFKNYWKKDKENIEQNWLYDADYNNPYLLANEVIRSEMENKANAQLTANYEFTSWLKATARIGSDFYTEKFEAKTPLDVRNSWKGAYSVNNNRGYSVTGDGMLLADKAINDFNVGGLIGAGITYYHKDWASGYTNGGLVVPGFYSLKSSKDLPGTSSSLQKKQVNSLYGKVDLSWKSALFIEVTGRNDWVSTLEESERSYFYPSVSGSAILSELIELPDWFSFLKLRSSWTVSKKPASVYAINKVYGINQNTWDGQSSAYYPTTIRDASLRPETKKTFEVGTTLHFFKNRLRFDVAYYRQLQYDIQRSATLSSASGFYNTLINYGEEREKKGWELTLSGDIIDIKDLKWTATANWGRDRYYYHKIDDTYSTDRPWVKPGERWDWFEVYDWERDPEGNIVHSGGMPVLSKYPTKTGFERASWVWGFNNHISYKNFTLDFSIDGRVGGKAYNRMEQAMWNSGTHPKSDNQWRYDEVVNEKTNYVGQGVKVVSGSAKYDSYGNILEDSRVFAPNDVAVSYEAYTKQYHPWNGSTRSQNIQDLTFLKLREIAIGYKVPASFLSKTGLKNMHFSLVGQNLLFWAKEFKYSDPDGIYENGNDYEKEVLNAPAMRYVGFNLKFDF